MRVVQFVLPIIGDGKTPETAFRADMSGVVDPITGAAPVRYSSAIESDENGLPMSATCVVTAEFE